MNRKGETMFCRRFFATYLFVLMFLFWPAATFAQETQKVTITVGEASEDVLTFEPKEVKVNPGEVEFTLVNNGQNTHNVSIKLKDKVVRLARAEAGKSAASEPVELAAGTYEIYCSFSSGGPHKDRGMAGKLIVK